ncbi:ABC-F family ATP-binding cassette domain-containing protein [Clostridiales Family XIII bacterium BX16]|uniref:ABC-F family ATP-binding cassette domain-containing protein n=1 Tax=Lentihominibacter faecis TaxID=2764712 RepID=A0A923NCF2_9FIRM|nr:ABC-F family ATP-binding cassette domain-containing protein [Lentihominibacter faecis]MBC5999478.1 ABC-F family ATP-binding cassette domain-containing protein [Lentihominibacter faecis]
MIQVEELSFGFTAKDLYKDISFTLEAGQHCALIGSNGTGKSTLAEILIHPEEYLYDGKIVRDESCRIGYASQFSVGDKFQDRTVFEFLSERFTSLQKDIETVCAAMTETEDLDALYEQYQQLLDQNEAMDGDHYESKIRKSLAVAGMNDLAETKLADISGGEYKMLQIMREMLLAPNLLVLDEPDVFLDFGNLGGLAQLINEYEGTMLVITHDRYLLNHCFNKILHLENGDLQEFDGTYSEYRCSILREKLALKLQNIEEQEEIARTQELVDILRKRATEKVNPVIGRSVNAKQSQLDRLVARQIKAPFIEIREPEIVLPKVNVEEAAEKKPVLTITDYQVSFEEDLLENVSFQLFAGEKAALIGANGTGKTTLIRDILQNDHPAIHIDENTKYACLSQLQEEGLDEEKTVFETLQDGGFATREDVRHCLARYCLQEECMDQKVSKLSGGEKNMLQIALLAASDAQLLILDEPTSHLDLYAQTALEKAIADYEGTVLMVTHDFYLAAGCADYILLVEDHTVRRMRTRKFRKMVYDKYFDSAYLETDRKKQELEAAITTAFKKNDLAAVDKLCGQLEEL